MRDQAERHWPDRYLCGRNGIALVPVQGLNAETANEAYRRTREDGLLYWVFANSDFSIESFRRYFAAGSGNYLTLMFADNRFSGYAWVNGVCERRAFVHYCMFKDAWGRKTVDMARTMIEYWLAIPSDDGYLLDVLIGSTPVENRKAIRFLKLARFREVGTIPKAAPNGDALISYATRESYYGQEQRI